MIICVSNDVIMNKYKELVQKLYFIYGSVFCVFLIWYNL